MKNLILPAATAIALCVTSTGYAVTDSEDKALEPPLPCRLKVPACK